MNRFITIVKNKTNNITWISNTGDNKNNQISILKSKPSKIATIDDNILKENEDTFVNVFLFGKPNIEDCLNKNVLVR